MSAKKACRYLMNIVLCIFLIAISLLFIGCFVPKDENFYVGMQQRSANTARAEHGLPPLDKSGNEVPGWENKKIHTAGMKDIYRYVQGLPPAE